MELCAAYRIALYVQAVDVGACALGMLVLLNSNNRLVLKLASNVQHSNTMKATLHAKPSQSTHEQAPCVCRNCCVK